MPTTQRCLPVGSRDLTLGSSELGELTDATAQMADPAALRDRLDEDGYLLLRGLHNRDLVLEARRQLVQVLRDEGMVDAGGGPLEARMAPGAIGRFAGGDNALTRCAGFHAVVEHGRIRRLIEGIYGADAITFSYKWVRVVSPGQFTGAHYDVVYMGRGSQGVLTVWTPFGDLGYEHGPLAVVPGSHRLPGYQRVRDTYGRMDVDRDRVVGWFSDDPLEVTRAFGGSWATAEFRAGDVLIFGMHMMHMSLRNTSDELRLTADTRWQKAGDPVDDRWAGAVPRGHDVYRQDAGRLIDMATKRREWGV